MKLNEDLTYNERLLRIQKLESENANLRKELNEIGRKWLNDFSRQDTLITELKARWEELKKLLLDVHNCEGCGHRCVLHVDAWCDIIEDLMEQELSEKHKGMKG